MDLLSVGQLLAAAFVALVASAVKGTVGLGFPVITVPVLSAFGGPHAAAALPTLPILVGNLFILGAEGRKLRAVGGDADGVVVGRELTGPRRAGTAGPGGGGFACGRECS